MGDSQLNSKGKNRFKYKSFQKQINDMHIQVINTKKIVVEQSYFLDKLEHWEDLDCTSDYTLFKREIAQFNSLPLVLFHLETVVEILLNYLPKSPLPILDLIVALSLDLQEEFYPFFKQCLTEIVSLSDDQTPDVIQAKFQCIAHLFKSLNKNISSDILIVFGLMKSSFEGKFRLFAAESFGYLLRKTKNNEISQEILSSIENSSSNYQEGICMVLFQAFKLVNGNFHSNSTQLLEMLLVFSLERNNQQVFSSVFSKLFLMIGNHCQEKKSFVPFWELLFRLIDTLANNEEPDNLAFILDLMCIWIGQRKGSRVSDFGAIYKVLGQSSNFVFASNNEKLKRSHIKAIVYTTLNSPLPEILSGGRPLLNLYSTSKDTDGALLLFQALNSPNFTHYGQIVAPYALAHAQAKISENVRQCLTFLESFCGDNYDVLFASLPYALKNGSLLRFPKHGSEHTLCMEKYLLETVGNIHLELESDDLLSSIGTAACCLKVLSNMDVDFNSFCNVLWTKIESAALLVGQSKDRIQEVMVNGDLSAILKAFIGLLLSCFCSFITKSGSHKKAGDRYDIIFNKLMPMGLDSPSLLRGVAEYAEVMSSKPECNSSFNAKSLEKVLLLLHMNIGSYDEQLRLETLRILNTFERPALLNSENTALSGPCNALKFCLELEQVPRTLGTSREIPIILRRLDTMIEAKAMPKNYSEYVARYCFSLFSINFSYIWLEAGKTLTKIANAEPELFLKIFREYFMNLVNNKVSVSPGFHMVNSIITKDESNSKETITCVNLKQLESAWSSNLNKLGSPEFLIHSFVESVAPIHGRLDLTNIMIQLIRLISHVPHLLEKESKELVECFLNFLKRDSVPDDEESTDVTTEQARKKILEFMSMFAKVRKPRKLHKSSELYSAYLNLLSHGDGRFQANSLECIITWQEEAVVKFSDKLKNLSTDSSFRDALATTDLEEIRNMSPSDQKLIIMIVSRILYGKAISRKGKSASKSGLKSRRIAIFSFISRMDDQEREHILELMFAPFKAILEQKETTSMIVEENLVMPSNKQQIGFLIASQDFIKQLQSLLVPAIPRFIKTFIYLIHYADKNLESCIAHEVTQAREIRQQSLKRLSLLFSLDLEFDFDIYVKQLFESYIDRRIPKLHLENTQAPTALLELFSCWTSNRKYVPYLNLNREVIPQILRLLSAPKVQESVIRFVLNMVENLQIIFQTDDSQVFDSTLLPWIPLLLEQLEYVLLLKLDSDKKIKPGESVAVKVIQILARISPHVTTASNAEKIVDLLFPFLRSSSKAVTEEIKVEILSIFGNFMTFLPSAKLHPFSTQYYPTICELLYSLVTVPARNALTATFGKLADLAQEAKQVYDLLLDLNAYSAKRINLPDFNRRFDAFAKINQDLHNKLTVEQWRPLLYVFFHYVKDVEEFSIRTSASFGITQFIKYAACNSEMVDSVSGVCIEELLTRIVYPLVKVELKNTHESVRSEIVGILGALVNQKQNNDAFKDMVCLLANGDDEANFFSNIYHMQVHRRIRALRNLAAKSLELNSTNLATVFIPLVSHFVLQPETYTDHNVINEAIACIAKICGSLKWIHYSACLRRFLSTLKRKPALEKVLIRLLIQILNNFHFEMRIKNETDMDVDLEPQPKQEIFLETTTDEIQEDLKNESDEEIEKINEAQYESMEIDEEPFKVHHSMTCKFLPALQKLISEKNDETIPTRIPLAIAIAELLKKLPRESLNLHLPKLLMIVCNVLSSHLQSARDSARETLIMISSKLSSPFLAFILGSLENSLKRGYQLHVLSYVIHGILEANVESFAPGSIDSSVQKIVSICMNDIFGEPGKERQVKELKNKMREMKTTKSFDTLEYLARMMSFESISIALIPIKEQMLGSNDAHVTNQIKEIFKRLSIGINLNKSVAYQELMIFIYQLVTETLPLTQQKDEKKKLDNVEATFKVQLKRTDPLQSMKYYEANAHLFIEFGLSLLLTSLQRENINLNNMQHLEMLEPMIVLLGKALYSKHEVVNLLSIRIFCWLVKYPFPSMTEVVPLVVRRLFQFISTTNLRTELIQGAFRLLSMILRECPDVEISEKQLIALISMLQPELEEPEHQSTTFSLIKAILSRKIIVIEVYDLMDKISRLLVTSQSSQIRDLCRQTYIQFLLNYPHGHSRLRKQFAYLTNNLEYEFESGRISILELFNVALKKISDEVFFEYSDMLFLALVMCLANDDAPQCREMAAYLIKSLFSRLDTTKIDKPVLLLEKWMCSEDYSLKKVSVQVFGLLHETFEAKSVKFLPKWLQFILDCLVQVLEEFKNGNDDEWELGYLSCTSLLKILKISGAAVYSSSLNQELFSTISELLIHPHQWLRRICGEIIGVLLGNIKYESRCLVHSGETDNEPYFLLASQSDVTKLAKRFLIQLDSEVLGPELAQQIVRNLFMLSKCLVFMFEDDLQSNGLLSLTKKMAYLARAEGSKPNRGILLRESVFKWFAAVYPIIPKQSGSIFLELMISSLYRVEIDDTFKGPDAGKQLAVEVLSLLQKHVGTSEYVQVYQSVQQKVQEKRIERKTAKAVMAVKEPEKSAARKIQKNEMKKQARKRKAESFMIRKGKKLK